MDALDRMFARLVHNLRNTFPELLGNPFEVGELYQTVIPYRHNRRELGLESNQDYELTLMALLSGARGYIVGEGRMQEALRSELASSDPDTTLFRSFASARVAVATDALRRFDQKGESGAEEQPPLGPVTERSTSSPWLADAAPPPAAQARPSSSPQPPLPEAFSHPLGTPLYGAGGAPPRRESLQEPARSPGEPSRSSSSERPRDASRESVREAGRDAARETAREDVREIERWAPREPSREPAREPVREEAGDSRREPAREAAPPTVRDSGRPSASEPILDRARQARDAARNSAHEPLGGRRPGVRSPSPTAAPSQPPSMTSPTRPTTASALGGTCRYCSGTLPDGRRIVFCPHCGQNLTIQHCPACSTELELGWKFCTTCGRGVGSA